MHSIWRTRQALRLHVTVGILLPIFLGLAWWQLKRALGGNTLSWAYAFEWPFFAGYAIYMWWKLLHDQERPAAEADVSEPVPKSSPRVDARAKREDDERAVYNAYLAELHASDQRQAN